jgi:hypothetical protein
VDDFFVPRPSALPDASVFGALGRALALATRFESECKVLHKLVSVKSKPSLLQSEAELSQFLAEFERRNLNSHVAAISKLLNAEVEPLRVLNNARIARNNIAHESTLGFEHWNDWPKAFGSALKDLREWVRQVGQGLQLVSTLSALVTHEPLLVPSLLRDLPAHYERWVFEGFENEDP